MIHTGEHGLKELLLRLLFLSRLRGIAVTADGGIALASLQHQIALRLKFQRTIDRAHKHLHHVSYIRQIDYRGEQILGDFSWDDLGKKVSKGFTCLVCPAFGVTEARVFDVQSRFYVDLVACLQGDVLTLDGDIAVGGIHGDAREGIDRHRAVRRVDLNGTLVALHIDLVYPVAVADMDTTRQIFGLWQEIGERRAHDRSP